MLLYTIVLLIFPIMVKMSETSDIWHRAGRMTGLLLNNCFWMNDVNESTNGERILNVFQECLKKRALRELHRAIGKDVIEVVNGVELVKRKEGNYTDRRNLFLSTSYHNTSNWKQHYLEAVKQLFETHILKIHLKNMDGPTEGRTRRRQNMFSQLLMFGLVAASFIVIPMGFQFLAILGGKALLLAKMALLLSSIQGLKKIATSNFNYGLYSTHGHGHGYYQPCKTFDYPGLLDAFLSFDIESLKGGGYGYFCLGQYDRQWPFEGIEGQRAPESHFANYEAYDDFHPRKDEVKE